MRVTQRFTLEAGLFKQKELSLALSKGEKPIFQSIPWYEQEGVFPKLCKFDDGEIVIVIGYDKGCLYYGDYACEANLLTPLSTEQAAKYGVE